jgi:hypothetical protein
MILQNKKEKLVYDCAGGGEVGERAVIARRDYIDQYNYVLRDYYREKARNRFLPRSESDKATSNILYDDYD